ncbi:chemotaxis protein CheA [Methylobacterium terricola]|uniref:Chemotaxis protein CheA n=1 Tax=Methylobacterium terricola TaxID=2583531 RepID=A0A5C4LQ03_9HYPH|nr:chemotaxis protein CheA [Methylobacterium terricola]TNC16223.1 chemotaxis protein CheA [Methylobacterium terricola]
MMPVEIDPSEVRRPRQDSPERRLRPGRPAMLAGLAVIGIGGCAGLAAAAYPMISDLLRPRPAEVHFGRVADMPEIKDGIPALRTTPPPVVRQVAIPPANAPADPSSAPAAASPPVMPAALLDPKPTSVAPAAAGRSGPVQGASVPGGWSPASDVAATGTAGAFRPMPSAVPKASETPRGPVTTGEAATPREDVKPREAVKPRLAATPREAATPRQVATPREAPPLPPTRAVQAAAAKPAPPKPPAREAKVEAVKPAAQKPAADKPVARRDKPEPHQRTAAAQTAPAPQPEEPTRFLGVPMPDFAPAGRAIKDTVDAVIAFPSRL